MTREEILQERARYKAFAETPLGKAFLKFKFRLERAVAQDTEDSLTDGLRLSASLSPTSTKRAWDEAKEAEREFRAMLEKIIYGPPDR